MRNMGINNEDIEPQLLCFGFGEEILLGTSNRILVNCGNSHGLSAIRLSFMHSRL